MATDINVLVLVGRLVRDGELKTTKGKKSLISFTLAVNKGYKTSKGKWEEKPSFFDCVYFGPGSKGLERYLKKGKQVGIKGELMQQSWQKDGENRHRIVVVAESISLLGPNVRETREAVATEEEEEYDDTPF